MIRRVLGPAAWCAVLVAACTGLAGCDQGTAPASTTAAQLAPPDQVYTVRGRIRQLPDPARPGNSFQVHHEAIDDFVHQDGNVGGMDAMVMPFTPARELSLEEFEIGDIVELVFEVRWKTQPRSRVVQIRKLPPETPLEFRRAQPPGTPPSG